jgi:hypothetical protein
MRIPSGVTDQYIYFVAVDATDLKTRETGLSSFTVYRSRDGAAAAAFTTPTINETSSANMPGVYELLLDEDMTIASGNDTEEICVHITHAGMAPVTRVFELFRPKITAGETLTVDSSGNGNADCKEWLGGAIAAVSVTGVPEVDVTHYGGTAGSMSGGRPAVNTTYFGGVAGTFSSGRPEVNNTHWAGSAVAGTSVAGVPEVDITHVNGSPVITSSVPAAAGTADSGSTTTLVDAARTEADTDYWKGALLFFTSGNIAGQSRIITGFNAGTDTITFSPATTQAVTTQTYEIWPAGDFLRPTVSGRTAGVSASGIVDANIEEVDTSSVAAARLALMAANALPGTVDDTGFAMTTTEFEADDITEATADHFKNRVILWTSGAMQYQAAQITAYSLVSGRGHFTTTAMTEAPANNATFIII